MERANATSIDAGDGAVGGEVFDEGLVDAGLFALNVDGVDEEFGGIVG